VGVHWTAQELLDLVLDPDSFESWDEPIDISDAPPDYRAALEAARAKAGTDESVLTGRGLVHGRPVAVLAKCEAPTRAVLMSRIAGG
jgi:acetyl-CoA carboxylase carboxyl transferase subunit beta